MPAKTPSCTTSSYSREATKVIAWTMESFGNIFVAPYCEEHGSDIEVDLDGKPAWGPALAKGVQSLSKYIKEQR